MAKGDDAIRYVDVYLHGDKDRMWEIGAGLGLEGEALMMFRHACTEVNIRLAVTMKTGTAEMVAVDGRDISGRML